MRKLWGGIGKRAAAVLVMVALVAAWGYWPRGAPGPTEQARQWTCSMHPQVRQAGPGRCPLCGMDLIPVEALAADQEKVRRQAGVETEPVAYRELFKEVRTVGKLDYNEAQVAYLTARIPGRVDHLYVDFTGIRVKKGDHLVDLYSPDLVVAQDELIRAVEARRPAGAEGSYADAMLDAARAKLRLLGILPEQLAEIERTRQRTTHLTIHAPIGGTVVEKNVRAGQYVKEGDPLYRIANLDPIWLYLDVYEYDLAWVRYGQVVDVTVEAFPGETFRGTIVFVDPFLDDKTRTVKVRVNLKNAEHRLKPAMYASASIRVRLRPDGRPEPTGLEGKYVSPMHPEIVRDEPGTCPICGMALERVADAPPLPVLTIRKDSQASKSGPAEDCCHADQAKVAKDPGPKPGQVLAVPASAVLDTGRRRVVYRQTSQGAFELVEVQVGPRAEGQEVGGRKGVYFPVLAGLRHGARVVVRGGFLLDSQRQIEGMPSLLYPEGQSAANLHAGHGESPVPASAPPSPAPPSGGHKH